jgi:hypothetical protein
MKAITIDRYWKWKAKAKKSAEFKAEGTYYSQAEFEALIGHKPAPKAKAPVNTYEDITDVNYGDLEEQDTSRHTEES